MWRFEAAEGEGVEARHGGCGGGGHVEAVIVAECGREDGCGGDDAAAWRSLPSAGQG